MKHSILCESCAKSFKEKFERDDKIGEFLQSVKGTAKRNYLCDNCASPIKANSACVAYTEYDVRDNKQLVYLWHKDYIVEI